MQVCIRASRYLRHREYPQPPPPSRKSTNSTIKTVSTLQPPSQDEADPPLKRLSNFFSTRDPMGDPNDCLVTLDRREPSAPASSLIQQFLRSASACGEEMPIDAR
jgi:hypothetical protein